MKKSSIFALALTIAASAQAQEIIYDALNWSENDYAGTARTMGMGNAVTAVGGDPGSIAINPAGSAVASYSQVELTPGGSICFSSTGWKTSSLASAEGPFKESAGRFIFPNGGFSLNFNTGNSTGLVRWSFGFTANASNIYNSIFSGGGENSKSSFASYLASYADNNGLSSDDLKDYKTDYCCATAFNSYVIDRMADYKDDHYIGVTENIAKDEGKDRIYLAGPVKQSDCHRNSGTKMDYVINFGFNISNVIYLGANLGITSLNYSVSDGISEKAVDPNLFDTGFREFSYSYQYRATGSGVYGKFGILATPIDGLRLGAAIQTPTSIKLTEYSQHSMTNKYEKNGLATSPQSGWTYNVVSPMRFNVGLAYTIAGMALVSVDYERADYGMMRFRESDFSDRSYFEDINNMIRGFGGEEEYRMQASNMVRAGFEIKPIPEFAIRAGYNFATSGRTGQGDTHIGSFGLGYISKGSFYCDAAAKLAFMPQESLKVYDDYYFPSGNGKEAIFEGPTMSGTRKLLSIVGTVGWRF